VRGRWPELPDKQGFVVRVSFWRRIIRYLGEREGIIEGRIGTDCAGSQAEPIDVVRLAEEAFGKITAPSKAFKEGQLDKVFWIG